MDCFYETTRESSYIVAQVVYNLGPTIIEDDNSLFGVIFPRSDCECMYVTSNQQSEMNLYLAFNSISRDTVMAGLINPARNSGRLT